MFFILVTVVCMCCKRYKKLQNEYQQLINNEGRRSTLEEEKSERKEGEIEINLD